MPKGTSINTLDKIETQHVVWNIRSKTSCWGHEALWQSSSYPGIHGPKKKVRENTPLQAVQGTLSLKNDRVHLSSKLPMNTVLNSYLLSCWLITHLLHSYLETYRLRSTKKGHLTTGLWSACEPRHAIPQHAIKYLFCIILSFLKLRVFVNNVQIKFRLRLPDVLFAWNKNFQFWN